MTDRPVLNYSYKPMPFYDSLLRPFLFSLPPETAHEFALESLRRGLKSEIVRKQFAEKLLLEPFGEIECFGLKFKNPVGVAAGFDKNGVAANQLAALGFGFIEVGTTTFHPQPGNPKPRLFRLPADKALINRAGFNNEGTAAVVERLKKKKPDCILGMNIGKSKIVPNEAATEDYLKSFELVHQVADYIVVNVSSPNTPNLRELQKADALEELLSALKKRNIEFSEKKNRKEIPLLVKIAPDLSETEIESITGIASDLKLAGIVATNTTTERRNLKTASNEIEKIGNGGLSGLPLKKHSTGVIEKIHRFSGGKLPIIGVGGVFTAEDAFEKIAAGAILIQIYTGFVYQGFTIARDINRGLAKILTERGFGDYYEAVGANSK
ncbi:MAG TPA: quinone-dependent dihydroorotate dehydrogenase [Pyrinomonadaceae bacterium]|nr:quinone-dependent dihydroorotate dehydrogenase [Pyrinomonadaceae bacterium]